MSIQSKEELEEFYAQPDPWDYEHNIEDKNRKAIILSELERLPDPKHVLDIGCGHGFLTRSIKGEKVIGTDLSARAVKYANKHSADANHRYIAADMFELTSELLETPQGFDLIIITGVIYPQYVGDAKLPIYEMIDRLLTPKGYLVSVHIDSWYTARLPYILLKNITYKYREYQHLMEIYQKQ